VFVADRNDGALLGFSAAVSGSVNVAPASIVEGSNTTLSLPDALAFDGVGSLYVMNDGSNSAAAFATGTTGNVPPYNTLTSTNPLESEGITFDSAGNAYISSFSTHEIDIFAKNTFGTATPNATITGSNTELSEPVGMAVDSSGTLYVANQGKPPSILTFANAATTNGNVAPTGVIAGSNTMLKYPQAVSIDQNGRIIVADTHAGIVIFAKGAMGNATPVAVISGNASEIGSPAGVAVDDSNNIWEADASTSALLEFAATANGNVAPIAQITGNLTMLNDPASIVFVPGADIVMSSKRKPLNAHTKPR